MRRVAPLALVLAALSPLPAAAQVTPERAAELQQQIRDWIQSTVGPSANRNLIAIEAAGDHYDVSAPLSSAPDAPVLTGRMTDAGNGRWAVDDVRIPSPSVFHYQLPPPKRPGMPGGEATATVTIGDQQQRMLLDPTFATASTWTSALKDLDLTTKLSNVTQLIHVESGTGSSTLTPAPDGRVDVAADSSATGYSMKMSDQGDRPPVSIAVAKLSVVTTMTGLSRQRGADLLRLAIRLSQPAPDQVGPGPVGRDTALAFVGALSDLASGATVSETANDLSVTVRNMTGSLEQLALGLQSSSDAGKLRARLPFAVRGLVLPDLGLGSLAQLVPTKLAATPIVSDLPTTAFQQLLGHLAADDKPTDADIAALFAQGPVDFGLDDVQLDVAGSSFAGHVRMLAASPSSFSGTGQVAAENFDRLQQAVTADPQSAPIAPLLIFMKGIGRTEQDRLIWDLAYRDGHLLVNGQDMAALMAAMAPHGPPAQSRPTRPRP